MSRFKDAQVGDLVYCRLYGDGAIEGIKNCISVILDDDFDEEDHGEDYGYDGRLYPEYKEPTLFYRLGPCRYLTARPANGSKQAFRDCRECLGLDRVAMAATLGVSRHTVRNWETEKHPNCPPDWVWKLIERLEPVK